MPARLSPEIYRGTWSEPPIFELIRRVGKISRAEMDRTFNNGIGMIAVVAPDRADAALGHLKRRKQPAFAIGELTRGERGVAFV
jgi:phosphoribosylformylglycinamidine cyclo-ligase